MGTKKKNISLFDDEEEGDGLPMEINKGYAQRYDNWRRLEEMQKIKDRYGDVDDDSESSEEEPEWTEEHEEAFLKTLGALKSGDKSCFKEGKGFFEDVDNNGATSKKTDNKKKDNKKMTIKDYERKLVLEKDGQIDESDDEEQRKVENRRGYHEEQEELRKSLASAIHNDIDEVDDNDLLVERKKSKKDLEKDEEDFAVWLKSEESKKDSTKAKELKHLKKFWKDEKLDESEKFLRDYLLNKDYEPGEAEQNPTYEDIVALEEDEKELDKNRQYERKYNFRFEDPDQEFIKQYPRTVAESMRTDTNSRKDKRHEREERKKKEKEEKIRELKELQKMKKSEIEQKLLKLKKAAGCDIPISLEELNADFDPKEFDKKMQQIFNEEYYGEEENIKEDDDEKPVFSDMEDSDYEDYDKMDDEELEKLKEEGTEDDEEEQEDEEEDEDDEDQEEKKEPNKKFDMVAAAQKAMKKDLEGSRRKKKRNALKEALARKKPLFNPKEKTFEEYFNEYYALDYEDIIGDQVTRFKYREVEPNNFGLSTDEILDADDRQLNAWASLKKVTAYRSSQEENFDRNAYERKSNDVNKKKRIFSTDFGGKKSLKRKAEDEEMAAENGEVEVENEENTKKKKKRGKKKPKMEKKEEEKETVEKVEEIEKEEEKVTSKENGDKAKRKRNKGFKKNVITEKYGKGLTDSRVKAYGLNPNRLRKGLVYGK